MDNSELKEFMTFNKAGVKIKPLFVIKLNNEFILGAYQGSISKYDILIKYRQRVENKWSKIRTPKHIHWAVDVLIKMHSEKEKTIEFLAFLIEMWENTFPIKTEKDREKLLNINSLIESNKLAFEKYNELSNKGEYNIKFLILLAKLLMIQEKTNLETAYMFKNLIEALKSEKDIFKIVSIASYR